MEMVAFVTVMFAAGWRPGDPFPEGHVLYAASGAAFTSVVVGQMANAFAGRSTTHWPGRLGWTTNRLLLWAVGFEVLYWLHLSRRDLVRQCPANDGSARGTFSLRSPVRPNPIGTSIATLVRREREQAPNLLLLDCGDIIQGTAASFQTRGGIMATAMNAMGYDAMGVGMMEGIRGLDVLLARAEEAAFPILSANLAYVGGERLVLEP